MGRAQRNPSRACEKADWYRFAPPILENVKRQPGPNSGGGAFSTLVLPPALLLGRRHWALPMPLASPPWPVQAWPVQVRRRGAARQNRRRDRPAPTEARL